MARENTLTGWVDGSPPERDDGGLAVVELLEGVTVDGQDHYGLPIIVSRWGSKLKTTGSKLKTTGSKHRVEYSQVRRHIDIAKD